MNEGIDMEVNITDAAKAVGIGSVLWAYCRWILGLHIGPVKDAISKTDAKVEKLDAKIDDVTDSWWGKNNQLTEENTNLRVEMAALKATCEARQERDKTS